jgi:hypothetical protein
VKVFFFQIRRRNGQSNVLPHIFFGNHFYKPSISIVYFSFSLWLCPRVKGTELDIISIYLLKKMSAISNGYMERTAGRRTPFMTRMWVRMIGQLVRTLFSLNSSFCSYYILKDWIRTSPIWMSDKGRKSNECVTTWNRLVFLWESAGASIVAPWHLLQLSWSIRDHNMKNIRVPVGSLT